jgi:TolB-like protein
MNRSLSRSVGYDDSIGDHEGAGMSFLEELKRRNVIRLAILYLVGSWLLLQLTDVLSSLLPVPNWTGSLVFMLLLLGLPLVLVFAWVYEMTPEGLKREKDIDRSQSITGETGKKINVVIVVLLVLAIAGLVVDRLLPETAAPLEPVAAAEEVGATQRNSIAVLPFADLSEAGDQQFFTDGLSEELLNLLVRIDGLRVASRTSAFAFRESSLAIPQIAASLGVAHVLEGSVRRSGDRIRVTAQLIDAQTDQHLWSDNFDRELTDIFAIQDEIGNAIVEALKSELGILDTVSVNVNQTTSNIDAYAYFLEARELFIRRENLTESIRLYNEALSLDPGFAKAWEGLAAVEIVAGDWIFDDGIDHAPLALAAAEQALAIDPDLSMPYAVLGLYYYMIDLDLLAAEDYFRKAVELDPKNTSGWLWYAIAMNEFGFFDKAAEFLGNCLAVNPGYDNCKHHLSSSYLSQGRVDEAVQLYETTLQNDFHSISEAFVWYYVKEGNTPMATLLAHRKFGDSGAPVIEWIRAIETPNADHSLGYARLKDWERKQQRGLKLAYLPPVLIALERYEEMFESLNNARLYIWHPYAADFRNTPLFKKFVRDGRLLEYWQQREFPEFCRPLGAADFECGEPR